MDAAGGQSGGTNCWALDSLLNIDFKAHQLPGSALVDVLLLKRKLARSGWIATSDGKHAVFINLWFVIKGWFQWVQNG